MAFIRSCVRLLCCRLAPFLFAVVAVFVGWLLSTDMPMGTFFASLYLVQGLFTKPTPAVPVELTPLPRPKHEIFFKLPSGLKMPASGMGMCCRPTAYHHESARRTVLWYLLQGGRLIDTASLYLNHKAVGEGIRDAVARGIPRSEIFLTTKVFPTTFGYNSTAAWVKQALSELQVDYIDLVLLHSPRPMPQMAFMSPESDFKGYDCRTGDQCRAETWLALAEARKKGLIKEIGVSNFGKAHIQALPTKEAPVAVNQLMYNPWVPEWEHNLVKYCNDHNIAVTGYWTLGGSHGTSSTLAWDQLIEIGKKHNKSAAQVIFRWSIQRGAAVIPGSGNPKHMLDNINLYDFKLSNAEMKQIDEVGKQSSFLGAIPDFMNPDHGN